MFPKRKKVLANGKLLEDIDLSATHYAWCHGADGSDLSTLRLVFELARLYRPRNCVVIGSGDGLIPRVIREAQIKSGLEQGTTYLIDLGASNGALPEKLHNPDALFRQLYPEIVVYKNFSVPHGIDFIKSEVEEIDLLWIDGDHTYEGSMKDFSAYTPLLSKDGIIFMHDTAPNGVERETPEWCGVDKTLQFIQKHYLDHFEFINLTSTSRLNFGCGLAILKPRTQP